MDVLRAFIERLARRKRLFLPSFYSHHDGALQNVDEAMRIVAMDRVDIIRRVFNQNQEPLFAGDVIE
jgi:hypothetical protein